MVPLFFINLNSMEDFVIHKILYLPYPIQNEYFFKGLANVKRLIIFKKYGAVVHHDIIVLNFDLIQ